MQTFHCMICMLPYIGTQTSAFKNQMKFLIDKIGFWVVMTEVLLFFHEFLNIFRN
jgi:hypothetical protein